MRPRAFITACLLAFWLTLAATIGLRQPEETRLIALGVLLGVATTVPASLVVSGVAARATTTRYSVAVPASPDPEPGIVFVPAAPPPAAPTPAAPAAARTPPLARPRANVTLIGGDERDD